MVNVYAPVLSEESDPLQPQRPLMDGLNQTVRSSDVISPSMRKKMVQFNLEVA